MRSACAAACQRCDSVDSSRRHRPARGVYVALHFDQRDRSLRHAAVGVEHRIDAVFPALVGEAALRRARVIEQAIAIGVTRAVDPMHRGPERRPQAVDEVEIPGADGKPILFDATAPYYWAAFQVIGDWH